MKRSISTVTILGMVVVGFLFASQVMAAGEIVVSDPWIREPNPARPIAAGYLTLKNNSDDPNALVAVDCPDAGKVEMHRMTTENGMMRMKKIESIELPADQEVRLEPGGYHLMFLKLKKTLRAGDEVKLTLWFRDGTKQIVTAMVKKPGV